MMNNGIEPIRYLMECRTVYFHYSFISDASKSLSNAKLMKNNQQNKHNCLQNYYDTFKPSTQGNWLIQTVEYLV